MPNEWQPVRALPPLGTGELHLWRVHLSEAESEPDFYRQHLSRVELERADRLRAGHVRMQYLVARFCLRTLLGNLLNLPPSLVPLTLSAYGKPETPSLHGHSLFFNVAHSGDTILIALCRSSSVGVDVEYLERETEVLEIARNSFTPKELLQIEQTLDPGERRSAFFRCWTRKEAVLKADGRGLSVPLNAVEVPVLDPAASTPVFVPGGSDDPSVSGTWFVTDISLGDGVAGAFAVGLPHLMPRTFDFPRELLSKR